MDLSELTEEMKNYALTSGAELVGVISPDSIDAFPEYWIGWQIQESSKKSTDYIEDPKSIIVLGYHAFDDIYEAMIAHNGEI